jgi:hypothetical protein
VSLDENGEEVHTLVAAAPINATELAELAARSSDDISRDSTSLKRTSRIQGSAHDHTSCGPVAATVSAMTAPTGPFRCWSVSATHRAMAPSARGGLSTRRGAMLSPTSATSAVRATCAGRRISARPGLESPAPAGFTGRMARPQCQRGQRLDWGRV